MRQSLEGKLHVGSDPYITILLIMCSENRPTRTKTHLSSCSGVQMRAQLSHKAQDPPLYKHAEISPMGE